MGTVKKATPLPKQDGFQMQTLSDVVKRSERTDHQVFDGGELIEVEVSAAGEKDVLHKLGKTPSGFVLADIDTFVLIRRVSSDKIKIRLEFSGACNAKVMVF
jgi:hypothetical protein